MAVIERLGNDTLRIERFLPAPVETVWRYLTDETLRGDWFAGGPIEPRVGGEITLVFDHDNLSAGDVPYPGAVACYKGQVARERITRFDPPHAIAFSWDGGKEGEALFELHEAEGGTRLVLTHKGITGPAPMASFGGGWTSHLAVLRAVLSGETIEDFWALHAECEAEVKRALT